MSDQTSPAQDLQALLVFSGTGPILLLSTYSTPTDPRLVEKLGYKGMHKFIAYLVDLETTRRIYGGRFEEVARDLAAVRDARVLDYNGHQIMANFSLSALGEAIKVGD